ncbi:MAG: ABC transporter permease, partial [Acidimicrobiia bacterium]|nr:ABC transporter permease [Acidimicrobiia bacterium]
MIEFLGDALAWFAENWDGQDGYLRRGWSTILLCGFSTLLAAVIAVPLGALLGHYRRGGVAAV